ncbi:MAG TPA: hypothetical protein VIK60_11005 [Vicinamibacterales bacterium]
MSWPHEPEFRGRALIFWSLSILAFLQARSVPAVSVRDVVVGALVAAVVSLLVYGYARAIGRLDARFRHVHPRTLRVSSVAAFYLFGGLACGLVVGGRFLVARDSNETPAELMVYYLAVPCLLAAAAGVYRVLDQYRVPTADVG